MKISTSKTTLLGVLTIAGTLVNVGIQLLNQQHVDLAATYTAVTAGLAAIHAADAKGSA